MFAELPNQSPLLTMLGPIALLWKKGESRPDRYSPSLEFGISSWVSSHDDRLGLGLRIVKEQSLPHMSLFQVRPL